MGWSELTEEVADRLEQDEAYRERIQQALIPRELLQLPEAFARFQERVEQEFADVRAEMRAGFQRIQQWAEQEFANVRAEMREGFERVDQRLEKTDQELVEVRTEQRRQANDIAKLKGFVLELIFDKRAPSIFGRYWRRVKVITTPEVCEIAEAIQPLTPDEEALLYRADSYVMGVRKADGREIIGVVEVSWVVDMGDVARAQHRAEVLTRRGLLAVPIFAGGEATQTAEEAAQQGLCALLIEGNFTHAGAVSQSPA